MGVGLAKNPKALKLSVIERIIRARILAIPAAGSLAFAWLRIVQRMGLA